MRTHRRDRTTRKIGWAVAFALLAGTGVPALAAGTLPPGFDGDLYPQGAMEVHVFRRLSVAPAGRRDPFIMGTARFDGTGREGQRQNAHPCDSARHDQLLRTIRNW